MPEPRIESLSIGLIVADPSVQPRAVLNVQTIADYRDVYLASDVTDPPFPPGLVFQDGDTFWLSWGFHRHAGALAANRGSMKVEIRQGTKRDAILAAMQDNRTHGLRYSNEDKRKIVTTLLDDKEWSKQSMTQLAELGGVSRQFVANMKEERKPKVPTSGGGATVAVAQEEGAVITRRDGKTQPATKPGVKGGIESVAASDPLVLEKRAQDARKKADAAADKPEAAPTKPPKKGTKGIVALTGEEADAFDARAQVKVWAETIGRWLQQQPSIDGYRRKYPGDKGDRVVKAATELYEALKLWGKAIK